MTKALTDELAALRRKRTRRTDQPGFAANVAQIDARIAVIEAELASTPTEDDAPAGDE